jgi:hypothetical protein
VDQFLLQGGEERFGWGIGVGRRLHLVPMVGVGLFG